MSPKITFRLRQVKGSVRHHIQMVVALGFMEESDGKKKYSYLRINIGRRVNPINWDKKAGRPTLEFSMKDQMKLHRFIDEQEVYMTRAIESLIDSRFIEKITPALAKETFLKKTGKHKTQIVKASVTQDLEEFIENGDLKELTRRNYGGLLCQLKDYERIAGSKLYWHEFHQGVFDEFLDFLSSQNYAENTLWSYQKRLIAQFNKAKKRGYIPESTYLEKRHRFKTADKTYLNWSQVARIINYRPTSQVLRDVQVHFTVMVLTGVRYSDLSKFYQNLEPGTAFYFSSFRCSKAPHAKTLIPAFLPVKQALKNGCPPVPSNAQLNLKLKVLAGQVLPYSIAKDVTCHSLRRSFVSNMLSLGVVPEHVLMKILCHSHRNEMKVFLGYNKISLFENAQVLMRLVSAVDEERTGGLRLIEFVEQQLMN